MPHHACAPHALISHVLLAHASRRTALTSAEMSPARESGRPAGPWNTAGLWNATGAWNTLGAWNIAVRTRGVFTHRDGFQKPACVERGLVRTARGRQGRTGAGEGWRSGRTQEGASVDKRGSAARLSDGNRRGRKMVAMKTEMDGSRERPRDGAEGRGGEKASKKCSNMAKRAQIASLAISRGGGGQKDYICDGRNIWSREV